MKVIAACMGTALVLVTAAWAERTTTTTTIVPACPHAQYGVDGTLGPIFCVIDNPVALRYYAPEARHTFALGPSATPSQDINAVVADHPHGTEPILCSIYRLAAWRNHWSFGISIAAAVGHKLHFPNGWCSDPNFSSVGN
jgi:hypothetical protein